MKILIAYFSYTGHTKGIAEKMKEMTGGTLFEIAPAEAYSSDYDTTERQGRGETRDGYMPPLKAQVEDLESYDTILLGTPNWFNLAGYGEYGGEFYVRAVTYGLEYWLNLEELWDTGRSKKGGMVLLSV